MFDFEFGGTASFSKIYQKEKIFGYFAVDWSQSELYQERTVSASNFITLLSTMGGYSTVLTGFFGMLIASYQSFVFDKSMLASNGKIHQEMLHHMKPKVLELKAVNWLKIQISG